MNRAVRRRSFMIAALLSCPLVGTPLRAALASERWIDTRQVGPFICQATFPLDGHVVLLAELPELQREITRTLGLPPAREPIHIYLFASADEHRAFLAERFPNVPYRRALYVKSGGRAGVYAYRHAELDIDVRHECTHALLHAVLPSVPLWLDEGLAKYFEMPPAQRAFDHPNFDSLRWNMRLGMVQTIETLEKRAELSEMSGLDYRYAWAWVHFMLHGPKPAHRALVTYLASLRRDAPTIDAPHEQSIILVNYRDSDEPTRQAESPLSKQLAEAVPNPTEKMIHHFKHWHK